MADNFRHPGLHLLRGNCLSSDGNGLSLLFLNESSPLILGLEGRLSLQSGEGGLLVGSLEDFVYECNGILVGLFVVNGLSRLHDISSVRISHVFNLVSTLRDSHRLAHGVLALPSVVFLLHKSGCRGLMLLARVEFTHHFVEAVSLSIGILPELAFIGVSGVVEIVKLGFKLSSYLVHLFIPILA